MSAFQHPHGSVFYRRMQHPHPKIVRGEGVYLYDEQGKRYLDGSGGAIVVNIGHGVESVAQAMAAQASQAAYLHPTMFSCDPVEEYAKALAAITPLPDAKFYFLTSGAEAVEAVIKFARQLQIARGQVNRHLIIARWMSYHGATLGTLALTGKPKMRSAYLPMIHDMPHIPPPYCYRCPFGLTHPACDLRCADVLEAELLHQGPENVAAFLAEPISGATLGAVVPPEGYWQRVREICDRHGLLLIADEVMTGMGRTGKWFAMEHWGVPADLIVIGKGAAGGYFPLSALAARGDLVEQVASRLGDFSHGGTYSHHAVGAAVGLAVLDVLTPQIVAEVADKGKILETLLRRELGGLDMVGDIRGMGLMWGIELVQPGGKQSFPAKMHLSQNIADEAMRRGLIVYPGSGTVDGVCGDHIMLGPPFTITANQMEEMVNLLKGAIRAVVSV